MKSLRGSLVFLLVLLFAPAAHGQWVKLQILTCEGNTSHCINSRAARELDGSSADIETYIARAYYNVRNNDYKAALANYDSAIRMSAGDASLYGGRADIYARLGDTKRAAADRASAVWLVSAQVAQAPTNAAGYLARGLNNGRAGNATEELADYDRAIELGLNTAQIFFYRGNALLKVKEYGRALDDLNRAIGLGPKFAQLYSTRASLYHELGDIEDEQADLQKYAELSKQR